MNIGLIGTSHRRTAVKTMEVLYFNTENQHALFAALESAPITGLVMLMTCNRIEWYFEAPDLEAGFDWLITYIADNKALTKGQVQAMLYRRSQQEAVDHLFAVACGVESMVVGENEILTQVRSAYEKSVDQNCSTKLLNKLFQIATATGKRARTETQISKGAYSISSIAIEAIREARLDYFGRSILIIGTGIMGRRALKKLTAISHPDITLMNRTDQTAEILAQAEDVDHLPFDQFSCSLKNYDIVICTTSSKEPIIYPEGCHAEKDQLFVDLGVPRNVDTSVMAQENLEVLTVDSLKSVIEKTLKSRSSELESVSAIMKDESHKLIHWYEMSQACHV